MDPVALVVVVGFVGGLVIAALFVLLQRHSGNQISADVASRAPLSTPVINISSIKVEGVGGLGLVIVCIGVAVAIPSIGRSMIMAATLGLALAGVWIMRRRSGPLPSSGSKPGANTTLSIDTQDASTVARSTGSSTTPTPRVAIVGAC